MTKNVEAYSPIDQSLMKRPRGHPRTFVKLRTNVPTFPIDYDPRVVSHERAKLALTKIEKVWTNFVTLHQGGMDERELGQKALAPLETATGWADKVRAELIAESERLEREMNADIRKNADPTLRDSVHRHVTSLGAKALAFVNERISAGDSTTVSAVLFAPAYLSGLKDSDIETLRVLARKKFAPEKVAARAQLDKDVAKVEAAGASLLNKIGFLAFEWTAEPKERTDAVKGLAGDE